MSRAFDPYHEWLGIPPEEQPAHFYRLLGVELYEPDPQVIEQSANERLIALKSRETPEHSAETHKLVTQVVGAKVVLLNAQKKAAYDGILKTKLDVWTAAKAARGAGRPVPASSAFALLFAGVVLVAAAVGMGIWWNLTPASELDLAAESADPAPTATPSVTPGQHEHQDPHAVAAHAAHPPEHGEASEHPQPAAHAEPKANAAVEPSHAKPAEPSGVVALPQLHPSGPAIAANRTLGYGLRSHPPEAAPFNGHWYVLVPGRVSWDEAQAWCKEAGGYLACVESEHEQRFLSRMLEGKKAAGWIGGYQSGDRKWCWINGSPVPYQAWIETEPSGHGLEAAKMRSDMHGWSAKQGAAGGAEFFLCEWEF